MFLSGSKLSAIVIGGGEVAARKIELLLKSTSNITVMALEPSARVERLIDEHQLVHLAHNYRSGFLSNKTLAIAATDNSMVNAEVAKEANSLNILVNVVDEPELCTYITPSIIDRSPMLIALSSSGSAPILLRMLRESIEKTLPNQYGKLADFSLKFRDLVKENITSLSNRRLFWEQVLRGSVGEKVLNGEAEVAEQEFKKQLVDGVSSSAGKLSFVHTSSGNPDDLTLKAHRCFQFAETVFYQKNINLNLLEYIRRDAEKFDYTGQTLIEGIDIALKQAENGVKVVFLLEGTEDINAVLAILSQLSLTMTQTQLIEHYNSGSYQ